MKTSTVVRNGVSAELVGLISRLINLIPWLSLTGIMEPPMIGVMEPVESGRKWVSTSSQINAFHPLSQALILVFSKR